MGKPFRRMVTMGGDSLHLYHHDIQLNSLKALVGPGGGGGGGGGGGDTGLVDLSYLTILDETSVTPNSRQLVQGTGVSFTLLGKTLVISASGGGSVTRNTIKVTNADSPVPVPMDAAVIWTYYRGDATAGDIIFQLPHAVGSNMVVGFMKMDGTANGIVPTAFAGDLISDNSDYTVDTRKSVVWLTDADTNQWDVINVTPLA